MKTKIRTQHFHHCLNGKEHEKILCNTPQLCATIGKRLHQERLSLQNS